MTEMPPDATTPAARASDTTATTQVAPDDVRVSGAHARARRPSEQRVHGEALAWSGRLVSALTAHAAREGHLVADDVRIHPQTLEEQAARAATGGNTQLADSLRMAAELTMLPDRELLALYDLLRPGGASLAALTEAEQVLSGLGMPLAAAHFRDAANWYLTRGLIR